MIKKLLILIPLIISILLFGLTFRGKLGIPTATDIEFAQSASGQPFETSQERSRYAILLSLVNDHSFNIDNYASMGTPDIGKLENHYYSFFPPAVSVMAIPLYLLGLKLGATQMLTFSISTIFSILTILLIFKFCRKLNLHWTIALFSSIAFGFATNAWGYSVTLYAHLVSSFFILLGIYMVSFSKNPSFFKVALVWLLYSIAVFVDFPNLFIYLPIVITLTLRAFAAEIGDKKYTFKIKLRYIFAPIIFLALMGVYGYYNYVHFGNPLTLSNTLPRVRDLKIVDRSIPETGKDTVGALQTRSMLEGLRSFIVSDDRGTIFYAPVVLLFIFGLGYLKKKEKIVEVLLVAVPITCLLLYTMFGDPYGGWAYGSRYIIAILPELCILAGIGLSRISKFGLVKSIFSKVLYTLVFAYSAAISLMAPLTTNVIPPYIEARNLGLDHTYIIAWRMLQNNQLDSFVFNNFLSTKISGIQYYAIILSFVVLLGILTIWLPKKGKHEHTI